MSTSTCESLENDELFKTLLAPDIPSGSYTALSFADQIKHLSDGLDKISLELQSQVRQQHGALLSQASHAGKLSTALDAVCGHMERLQAGADRLKNQMQAPFEQVRHQTHVLARLHAASHLLRQSGRFLQLARKVAATPHDARAQSTLLHELEPLCNDATLAKIVFIRDERAAVVLARQRMNTVANNELLTGLKLGAEPQVSNSLQIFANLQTLPTCINNILTTFIDEIRQALRECFAGTQTTHAAPGRTKGDRRAGEPKRGPGKTPTLTTSQNFRTKLWTSIEWLFEEEIHSQCVQILFLQNCMQFVQLPAPADQSVMDSVVDIERRYWAKLEELLRTSFAECAIHVRQCLQQDLPKLLAAARGLQARFGTTFVFGHSVFEVLEAGYLEQCAVNLKASLVGTDCPKQETVDVLLRSASQQLSAAMVDQSLCLLVANAFNACNSDFLTKIEAHVKLGTDSQQVIDIPNAAQIRNTQLANCVHYHSEQTRRMVQNLGTTFANGVAAEIILKDLAKNETLVRTIVQQLFDSIGSATNAILLSMHREPGLNNAKPSAAPPVATNSGPSLYMKELHDFLNRSWNLHIVGFTDRQCVDHFGKELAERCIELFVRNAALLRPLSTTGRTKLRADCQHLEAALKPMVEDLSAFGRPFRQIRAFATLLTMTAEELSLQPAELDGPVAPIIVLLLLFGHAGPALTSPHTSAGWSNEKLLDWLDSHRSERERLELVNGALQKYRTIVRQRNIAQYDPVYPLIVGYVELVTKVVQQ